MPESNYYRFPTIYEDQIVFGSRDQLWLANTNGSVARCLTQNAALKVHPFFSPTGNHIAYSCNITGASEVYLLDPNLPGSEKRLTYLGSNLRTVGWSNDKILFASNSSKPFPAPFWLASVSKNGKISSFPFGPAVAMATSQTEGTVICRNELMEAFAWKQYRGGSRGNLWIDRTNAGNFEPLLQIDGNFSRPCWIGDRLFFLSDHDGLNHVYSCTSFGKDLIKHSTHDKYYARHLSTDGKRLVFSLGADIFLLDPAEKISKIDIQLPAQEEKWRFRKASLEKNLQAIASSPTGESHALTIRGKTFLFPEGAQKLRQYSLPEQQPICLLKWLDTTHILGFRERNTKDYAVITTVGTEPLEKEIDCGDLGRVLTMEPNPSATMSIALGNHRNELLFYDLRENQSILIDQCEYDVMGKFSWSPDGRYLAYRYYLSLECSVIKLWCRETNTSQIVTEPFLHDRDPRFDTTGKYLYFLSERCLPLVLGKMGSPCNISSAWQICRMEVQSKNTALEILPLPAGEYQDLWVGEKLYYLNSKGTSSPALYAWDGKMETALGDTVTATDLSRNGKILAFIHKNTLQFAGAGAIPTALSLENRTVSYDALIEWQSIFDWVWNLQNHYFWDKSFAGIDWQGAYEKYRPLLDRISTRTELSDLIWQLNGELKTSHAYEYSQWEGMEEGKAIGFLGAIFEYREGKGFEIQRILEGDSWDEKNRSPLHGLGSNIQSGDCIQSIDGISLNAEYTPGKALVGKREVILTVAHGSGEVSEVRVKPLASEAPLYYREWQRKNCAYVEARNSLIGYIHIPNTFSLGYTEFYRQYIQQYTKRGLILDLRNNTGGNLGEFILDRLRPILGETRTRGMKASSFPPLACSGKFVVLLNGFTGSDGELMAQILRSQYKATIIGTPSWGGVTGFKGRTSMVGGGYVTQPRTVFHLSGSPSIENRGVIPDHIVEIKPQDYTSGQDPQLNLAIQLLSIP